MNTIYDFTVKTLHGKDLSLKDFEGKVMLIVNTASKCGLTPQYEGLEKLYQKHKEHGLVIIGFPCNQFAEQEPGDEESITKVCSVNYGVTFPMCEKINVNGENTHPLYQFLKQKKQNDMPHEKTNELIEQTQGLRQVFDESDIVWNFCKFLINKNGEVIERFSPVMTPESIDEYIQTLLQ